VHVVVFMVVMVAVHFGTVVAIMLALLAVMVVVMMLLITVGVGVSVLVFLLPVMMVAMLMGMPVLVRMFVFVLLRTVRRPFVNAELHALDRLPTLAVEVHVKIADVQLRKLPFQRRRFDAEIDEGTDGHIAGDAGKAVEKKSFHLKNGAGESGE
jgi:hypothetical protein